MPSHITDLKLRLKKQKRDRPVDIELLAKCLVELHVQIGDLSDRVLMLERKVGIRNAPRP